MILKTAQANRPSFNPNHRIGWGEVHLLDNNYSAHEGDSIYRFTPLKLIWNLIYVGWYAARFPLEGLDLKILGQIKEVVTLINMYHMYF